MAVKFCDHNTKKAILETDTKEKAPPATEDKQEAAESDKAEGKETQGHSAFAAKAKLLM